MAYYCFVPNEQKHLDDGVFDSKLEVADIGGLHFKRTTLSLIYTEFTPLTVRRYARQGTLAFSIWLSGTGRINQDDRSMIQHVLMRKLDSGSSPRRCTGEAERMGMRGVECGSTVVTSPLRTKVNTPEAPKAVSVGVTLPQIGAGSGPSRRPYGGHGLDQSGNATESQPFSITHAALRSSGCDTTR